MVAKDDPEFNLFKKGPLDPEFLEQVLSILEKELAKTTNAESQAQGEGGEDEFSGEEAKQTGDFLSGLVDWQRGKIEFNLMFLQPERVKIYRESFPQWEEFWKQC